MKSKGLKTKRLTLAHSGESWGAPWRVCLKSGEAVGSAGFRGAPENKTVEVLCEIDAPHRGNGYAPEALKAILKWAFSQPGVYFIRAYALEGDAAARLLTKHGFLPRGEGERGKLYELEKPKSDNLSLYLCIGAGLGAGLGAAYENIPTGIAIGMSAGLALGALLDAADKKARAREAEQD
ncbi:MAG: GNAT family N-acetyltransferase [Clostridiaceae bacterium]|nr:GNAT family N-acetyltransferase [Eubacteriales bacterium]